MSHASPSFALDEHARIAEYYAEHGYVRVRRAVPEEKIDSFLHAYSGVKRNPFFAYYSQSLHRALRPELSADGYIKESMQNGSRLGFFPGFANAMRQCLFHPQVSDALEAVTGHGQHVSWQNMFFDQSTGTIEHQDSWYLDTNPAGGLVGVWYALEDIHPDSGPFFVAPGTHKLGLIDRDRLPNHDDYVEHVQGLLAEGDWQFEPMCLAKGEILIWHSFLVHGAFEPKDRSKSRKSLTSHFYPRGLQPKDTESGKLLSIYRHQAPRPTMNPRLFEAYRFSDKFYNLMVCGLFVKDRLKAHESRVRMRRDAYGDESTGASA